MLDGQTKYRKVIEQGALISLLKKGNEKGSANNFLNMGPLKDIFIATFRTTYPTIYFYHNMLLTNMIVAPSRITACSSDSSNDGFTFGSLTTERCI